MPRGRPKSRGAIREHRITVAIELELHTRLHELAAEENRTISDYMRLLLQDRIAVCDEADQNNEQHYSL